MKSYSSFMLAIVLLTSVINAQQFNPNLVSYDDFGNPSKPEQITSNYLERRGAWPYGSSISVAIDSLKDLIFLGSGGAVLVLDGSDKNNPVLISDEVRTYGLVEDIFYDDQQMRLYLACGEGGLEIWDVQVPSAPVIMSRIEILYFDVETPVGHVQVVGNYAILESAWGYVHSVDVSDPYNPFQIAFNGVMGNPAHDIHLGTDGRIHATGAQFYVRLEVGSNGSLSNAGGKEFIYGAYAVFGEQDLAYVGYGGYLYILDLLISGFPAWSITDVGGIRHIEVRGGYAYIINSSGFHIWDVSNVQSPVLLSTYPMQYIYDDLFIAGNFAYIASGPEGLQILNIADPSNPIAMGKFDTYSVGLDVFIEGNLAYLADSEDGLVIIDKSNLNYPEAIGHYPIPNGFMYQVVVQNNIAYTVCWTSGFRVVDVSDPANPVELAVDTSFNAWKLDVNGNYAYVVEAIANAESYVHIYDISNPTNPVELSSTQFPTTIYEVLYDEGYLYVANEDNGLRILDVSDPANPVEVSFLNYPDAFDVDIIGNVLYVCAPGIAQADGGFYTVDITDPQNPQQLDLYQNPAFTCFSVKAEGDYAYITDGGDIHIINVSNPSSLDYLEQYRMPGFSFGLSVKNGLVYVANADAGLQVLGNLQVVPVELVSFSASVLDNGVKLEWQTVTETNNSGFEILRSAGDENFTNLGFIEGHGTTTETHNYSYIDQNVNTGSYSYKLVQIDYDGTRNESEIVEIDVNTQPANYFLTQNYPNPFNPTTTIQYSIPESGNVKLDVFNSLGERVAILVSGYEEAGSYKISFHAEGLSSGIYFYRLTSSSFIKTEKMILLH